MNILLVDFNDSFTAILKHTLEHSGARNVEVLNVSELNKEIDYLNYYQGIILGPGPGQPEEYPLAFDLIENVENKLPILGICLGLQIITLKYGGTLKNLKTVFHGKRCQVQHFKNSVLYNGIEETFFAGFYHSWAIDNTGNNLEITSIRIVVNMQ
jgi:anthranilate/para-aminobenzoate synthase component II